MGPKELRTHKGRYGQGPKKVERPWCPDGPGSLKEPCFLKSRCFQKTMRVKMTQNWAEVREQEEQEH